MNIKRKNKVNKVIKKGVVFEKLTTREKLPESYKLIEEAKNWGVTRHCPPHRSFENFLKYYI